MSLELTVLTLNIWGIPWISSDRQQRIPAIAEHLRHGHYDVVSLQEVWTMHDYELIRDRVRDQLPYAHYFHSGVVGSGLCLFSRHPIAGVLFHAWPLNGYVHRVHHGDWFGGKGVGLARIAIGTQTVNVYVAHLHAEYDRENDDYKAHRVLQAFDTAQFIEATRGTSALQLLAGDLNTEPGDLAHRALMSVARLTDACSLLAMGTNECEHNAYTARDAAARRPAGKRIDYVLYRAASGVRVTSSDYSLPLSEGLQVHTADGQRRTISHSDHEAVRVRFVWSLPDGDRGDRLTAAVDKPAFVYRLRNDLNDCVHVCDETLLLLDAHRRFYGALALGVLLVLAAVMDAQPPYGTRWPFVAVRIGLSGVLLFAVLMGTLWNWMEANAVRAGQSAMEIALRATGDGR